jgi:hypothetical protein
MRQFTRTVGKLPTEVGAKGAGNDSPANFTIELRNAPRNSRSTQKARPDTIAVPQLAELPRDATAALA